MKFYTHPFSQGEMPAIIQMTGLNRINMKNMKMRFTVVVFEFHLAILTVALTNCRTVAMNYFDLMCELVKKWTHLETEKWNDVRCFTCVLCKIH